MENLNSLSNCIALDELKSQQSFEMEQVAVIIFNEHEWKLCADGCGGMKKIRLKNDVQFIPA